MSKAFEAYVADVRAGKFPSEEYTYSMLEGELEKLMELQGK
jgi:ketopantoate hydroxymethyltransferase